MGGLLDNKGYGIATRPGTPYKALLDQAILKLMEQGVLHKLKVKWWKQKRGGGACQVRAVLHGGGMSVLWLGGVRISILLTGVSLAAWHMWSGCALSL